MYLGFGVCMGFSVVVGFVGVCRSWVLWYRGFYRDL